MALSISKSNPTLRSFDRSVMIEHRSRSLIEMNIDFMKNLARSKIQNLRSQKPFNLCHVPW